MSPLIHDCVHRAGSILSHLILMFGMLVLVLCLGLIWLIEMGLAWIECQDTQSVLLLEWHATPERALPFVRHPLVIAKVFADSKWLWDFNISRSLARIKGGETKPMLLLEWHNTFEDTLSTVEEQSILLPYTRHPILLTAAFAYSKWLLDFDSNLFRSLFFRKCTEMQVARVLAQKPKFLINYGKTSIVIVQSHEIPELADAHSDADDFDDLEFDVLDQDADVGMMDGQFVVVAPEVDEEVSSNQFVLYTPRVEQDESSNQFVLVTPDEQDEISVDITPETEQFNTVRLPDLSMVELGFVLLRMRSTTCALNAAPETLDVESTYELLSYSTLDTSDLPPVRGQHYVYGYTVEPTVPAAPILSALVVHNGVGTGLGPRVAHASNETKAKNHWNSLGDADRAYYLRHVRLYATCRADYLAQKEEWERILTSFPWTYKMRTFYPTWKYCEPVFGQISPRFGESLGVTSQLQMYLRLKESESALKMCEKWIADHIVPEIETMLDWDAQHDQWTSDVEDAKAAAVTMDQELGKLWMAAKAKKDAREAAGWPVALTAQLQAILDKENAEVEMKENEIRQWWKPATRVLSITVADDDNPNGLTVAHWTPRFKVLDPAVMSKHDLSHLNPGRDFPPVFRNLWHFEMPETDMLLREMMVQNGQIARPMRTSPEEMQLARQRANEPYKDEIESLLGMTCEEFFRLCQMSIMEDISACICNMSTCEQCNPTAPDDAPPIRLEAWEIAEQTAERERAYMLRNGPIVNGNKRCIANALGHIDEVAQQHPKIRILQEMIGVRLRRDARRLKRANRPIVAPFYKPFEPAGKSLTEIACKAYDVIILKDLGRLPDAPPILREDLGLCRYPSTPQVDEAASLKKKLRGLKPRTKDAPEGLPLAPHAVKRKSSEMADHAQLREPVPFHNREIKKLRREPGPVAIPAPQQGVKRSIEDGYTSTEAPSKMRRTSYRQHDDDLDFTFAYKRFLGGPRVKSFCTNEDAGLEMRSVYE